MSESHTGSCHCGAVTYTFNAPVAETMECNCSYCRRTGDILAFGPKDALVITTGEEMLTEYLFNKHVIRHLFCKRCGVESFGHGPGPDGAEMAAINVRTLHDIDPWTLKPMRYDGAKLA